MAVIFECILVTRLTVLAQSPSRNNAPCGALASASSRSPARATTSGSATSAKGRRTSPVPSAPSSRRASSPWFDDKRTKTAFANAVLGGWHQFLDRWEIWLDEGRADLRLKEPDYAGIDVPGRP